MQPSAGCQYLTLGFFDKQFLDSNNSFTHMCVETHFRRSLQSHNGLLNIQATTYISGRIIPESIYLGFEQ